MCLQTVNVAGTEPKHGAEPCGGLCCSVSFLITKTDGDTCSFELKQTNSSADYNRFNVGIAVLSAVVMKTIVMWDIAPCSPLKVNRCFRGSSSCLLPSCEKSVDCQRTTRPYYNGRIKVKVKVMLRLTISQSVCLGVKFILELVTRYYFLSESCCVVSVGRPL
jgi:hypothetical protein